MRTLQLAFSSRPPMWFGVLTGDRNHVVASNFSDSKEDLERQLSKYAERTKCLVEPSTEEVYARDMALLFQGREPTSDAVFEFENTSNFQRKVYVLLRKIPRGRVTNYGRIAKVLHSGPRAVGRVVGSNPCSLFIPCHRVVPADMTTGNYATLMSRSQGSDVKRGILEREGVMFDGGTISPSSLWDPR